MLSFGKTTTTGKTTIAGQRIGRQSCTCTTADGTTLTGKSGPTATQSLESLSEDADEARADAETARAAFIDVDTDIEALSQFLL